MLIISIAPNVSHKYLDSCHRNAEFNVMIWNLHKTGTGVPASSNLWKLLPRKIAKYNMLARLLRRKNGVISAVNKLTSFYDRPLSVTMGDGKFFARHFRRNIPDSQLSRKIASSWFQRRKKFRFNALMRQKVAPVKIRNCFNSKASVKVAILFTLGQVAALGRQNLCWSFGSAQLRTSPYALQKKLKKTNVFILKATKNHCILEHPKCNPIFAAEQPSFLEKELRTAVKNVCKSWGRKLESSRLTWKKVAISLNSPLFAENVEGRRFVLWGIFVRRILSRKPDGDIIGVRFLQTKLCLYEWINVKSSWYLPSPGSDVCCESVRRLKKVTRLPLFICRRLLTSGEERK